MFAVSSLLDSAHDAKVREIWRELERHFCVHSPFQSPIAHISYQVFSLAPDAGLEERLRLFAARWKPFHVCTAGLGFFPGTRPVLHIPIVRSPQLSEFHEQLADTLLDEGLNIGEHYLEDRWIPHITLAQADQHDVDFPEMIRFLCDRRFYWELTIDNLALISGTMHRPGLEFAIPLAEPPDRVSGMGRRG
ncbi:MAG: 2'-5' RNA ligase family protein [Bradymonadaceae bacterium]|nr:2'-5' RNA ligase family protein [Lujinxingiaceae bacterium]